MKALWKGSVSFGLVNIPVKLYSGAVSHHIDLDMIRKKDHCAIQYVRVCKKDGKEVPWDDIAKGYKRENGDYVVLDKAEIASIRPDKSQTIDLFEFVMEDEVPAQYLEKPYLVEPEKSALKTYALLREALKKSGKAGLCKYVLRQTEHLGLLKVESDAILLIQMRFHEDLRDPKEVQTASRTAVSKKEVDVALSIIDQMTDKFEPEKYKDTYKQDLMKLIRKKARTPNKKIPVTAQRRKAKTAKPDDLLEQLKASLKAMKS